MDHSEINSFISKFMGLLKSGKNANLNIKSEAGKAFINLNVEVQVEPFVPRHKPRNGPARQRRREQRAAAREMPSGVAVAEEASEVEVIEQDKESCVSANAAEKQNLTLEKEEFNFNANGNAIIREPEDEIEKISLTNETKKVQAKPNDICGTISVIPIRHLNASDDYLIKSIGGKIESKKVKVRDIVIQRSTQGTFTRCDVVIEPFNGKDLEEIDFEFENCHVVPFYGLRIM
jgi:hypothetical protein